MSSEARRRASELRRKAKARSAHQVEKLKRRLIREADGAPSCHVCGGSIDLGLPARHPDSFELDHVVPISHGGSASYDNVAASHRSCNVAKSAGDVSSARTRLAAAALPSMDDLSPSPHTFGYLRDADGKVYSRTPDGKAMPHSREW